MKKYDVAVIGGGLSGLIAAIDLANAGKSVVLVEKSSRIGGRAMTNEKNGALFNLGVHAIYKGGAADKVYQELGLQLEGGKAKNKGFFLIDQYKLAPLMSLFLSFRSISWKGKIELIRFFKKLFKTDAAALPDISIREWVEQEIRDPKIRIFALANFRAVSYTQDPDHQLIGPVLQMTQNGLKHGILYVSGGWQSIVNQLKEKAVLAGVVMLTKQVSEIKHDRGSVQKILFEDGESLNISNVISTLAPAETYRLTQNAEQTVLKLWKAQARPSTAACLDICLNKLPFPEQNIALGLDTPVFFTNQSKVARLSPDGTWVMHVIKHNGAGGSDPKEDEKLLEKMMDLMQPGWQKEVIARQYLPNMTVSSDYPNTSRIDKFPGPKVPEIEGLYVAGDWAGHREILSDASAASARRAVKSLLEQNISLSMSV
jgi:phytoene dehydrogenase-like protein